jgi:hypothetical protein
MRFEEVEVTRERICSCSAVGGGVSGREDWARASLAIRCTLSNCFFYSRTYYSKYEKP